MTLGDRIFKLRKQLNLSQSELGNLVGKSGNSIAKYEKNERTPDPQTITSLATALNTTTGYLINGEQLSFEEEMLRDIDLVDHTSIEYLMKKYSISVDDKEVTEEELKLAFTMMVSTIRGVRKMIDGKNKS